MKKYLNILLGLVLCALLPAISCTREIPWDDGLDKPVIKGETKTVAVPYSAGETVLPVEQTAGFDVRISDDATDWLSAEGAGSAVTVRYTENPGLSRSGQVILTREDVMWIFTVNQDLNPTSGPHDIEMPFTEKGRVYGMIIYSLDPADLNKIPVGDKLVFDMTNNEGSLIIYDGSTNATILEATPITGKIVVEWTEELKNATLGFRMSTEANPIVKIHYTNIDANLPKEIEVPFSLLGEMGGMVIYGYKAGAFAEVEDGMDVIFEFETSEGGVSILNASNTSVIYGAIEGNKWVLTWNADIAAGVAGGGRIILNEGNGNHLVRIHAVDAGPKPVVTEYEVAFNLLGEMGGMVIYGYDAEAFSAIEPGLDVIFEFETSEGSVSILNAENTPVIYGGIEDNKWILKWNEELAAGVAGGGRIILNEGNGNHLLRIHATKVENPDGPGEQVIEIQCPDPRAGMPIQVYAFDAGAFGAVPAGYELVFELENNQGDFNILDATGGPVVGVPELEEPVFKVIWTEEYAGKVAGGARVVMSSTDNHIVRIYAHEVEAKVVTVAFGDPTAYNGWNIYQFPEGAFAQVEVGMTVTFTCENSAGGFNFVSAANAPVASGETIEGGSFSVQWTQEVADALAGGGRLVITDESNHLTKIEAR